MTAEYRDLTAKSADLAGESAAAFTRWTIRTLTMTGICWMLVKAWQGWDMSTDTFQSCLYMPTRSY